MKTSLLILILASTLTVFAQVGVNTAVPKSTLDVNGSVGNKVTLVTTNTILDINNAVVVCNNLSPVTVTLPSASNIAGRTYHIKRGSTANVTVNTSLSQTIDGNTTATLGSQYDGIQLISDGANWLILNKKTGSHYIGESFGGGIVFYIDGSGTHGLIAAPSDQSAGIKWNNAGPAAGSYFYAQLQGVFSGEANTWFIISFNAGTYAASICQNLVLNTYSDWYLPSIEELKLMYENLHLQGLAGFTPTDTYWSSTAFKDTNEAAYNLFFSSGETAVGDISDLLRVRAVRAF